MLKIETNDDGVEFTTSQENILVHMQVREGETEMDSNDVKRIVLEKVSSEFNHDIRMEDIVVEDTGNKRYNEWDVIVSSSN